MAKIIVDTTASVYATPDVHILSLTYLAVGNNADRIAEDFNIGFPHLVVES